MARGKMKLKFYLALRKLRMVPSPYEIYGKVASGEQEFEPPDKRDCCFLDDFRFATYFRDTESLIQAARSLEWKAYNKCCPFEDVFDPVAMDSYEVRKIAGEMLEAQLKEGDVNSLDEARRIGRALCYSDEETEDNLRENNPRVYEVLQRAEKDLSEMKKKRRNLQVLKNKK